jgi:hypothetical protein
MTTQEELDKNYLKRERLYNKGCNDEKLNDKIRALQQKIREEKV